VKAGLMLDVGSFAVEDVDVLAPGSHDVVVRIGASGVCHSDVSVLTGVAGLAGPMALGHEAAGTVEWIGSDVTRVKPGDRVIACLTPVCNNCWNCTRGETHLCEEGFAFAFQPRLVRDDGEQVPCLSGLGTFAETMTVHEWSLVPVFTELPDVQLALLGCGVTTGLGAVLNTARPPVGASIVVIGLGGVGTAALQGARIGGAGTLVAVDPVPAKREAAVALGATHVVDPGEAPIAQQIRSITGGRGADFVFEAVGNTALVEEAMAATRRGGTTVIVGSPPQGATVPIVPASMLIEDRSIRASFYGATQALRDLPRYIHLVESGRLDLSSMVSRQIGLADVGAALAGIGGEEIRTVVV